MAPLCKWGVTFILIGVGLPSVEARTSLPYPEASLPSAASRSLHLARLPEGTQVGPWHVVAWAGQGVHGAVYRAVPLRSVHLSPVALKLVLRPEDPRFAQEALLLSRLRHPSVPRL